MRDEETVADLLVRMKKNSVKKRVVQKKIDDYQTKLRSSTSKGKHVSTVKNRFEHVLFLVHIHINLLSFHVNIPNCFSIIHNC